MGRKSLPDPSKRSRPYCGFVEMVTANPIDVKTAQKREDYDTVTRGHRHTSPTRALGKGAYRILIFEAQRIRQENSHTFDLQAFEFPPEGEKNEPQEALIVECKGQCEFLLISASDDIDEELRLELKTEGETASATPQLKGTWV
ncbi:hypothetical protein GIB67_043216 [Kingdonia uniflora]|uniref:Uncharacterized protein n=1 Tax=Kingdonia uniflora TaxID=39325 RepID=A0A7J7NJJ0_9MAGN|nr:hypothetical protein GIB67_043216 [Kingdonia uniflora]